MTFCRINVTIHKYFPETPDAVTPPRIFNNHRITIANFRD